MKVFISWSGPRSRQVAECLREWLPAVLQATKPWMSEQDLAAGARWSPEIATQLKESKAGIICVTQDNRVTPWIMFESGALSQMFNEALVCPYLLDIQPSQLDGPLTQFQSVMATKDGTRKLINTLNLAVGGGGVSGNSLDQVFNAMWDKLEKGLRKVPQKTKAPERSDSDMLKEIFRISREQERQMQNTNLEILERLDRINESIRVPPLSFPVPEMITPKGIPGNPYAGVDWRGLDPGPKGTPKDPLLDILRGFVEKQDKKEEE